MTTQQLLLTTWHRHPSVLLGATILAVAYVAALRFRWTPRAWCYGAGVIVLLVALLSPLHTLGEQYLFSAHMLQHLLLLLIVPPLLLLGLPPAAIARIVRLPGVGALEQVLGRPVIAWTIGIGAMWLWHLPVLYNAALAYERLHIVEHLALLISAAIFWWPLFALESYARLHPLAALLYLFAAMIASGVLGMILTFAAPGLYPAYLSPTDAPGILPLLRGIWGLTPPVDQQLGGLLMWVPGSFAYLAAIVALLTRWYSTPDEESVSLVMADARCDRIAHEGRRTPDVA